MFNAGAPFVPLPLAPLHSTTPHRTALHCSYVLPALLSPLLAEVHPAAGQHCYSTVVTGHSTVLFLLLGHGGDLGVADYNSSYAGTFPRHDVGPVRTGWCS